MAYCNTNTTSALVALDCAGWPPEEQGRWIGLFDPAVRFGAPTWVRQTQYQNAGVYSRYLQCMSQAGFSNEVTPDGLRLFIRENQSNGCSARTISGYVWALYKVLLQVRSDRDPVFRWLLPTCRRLDIIAKRTGKKKHKRLADSAEVTIAAEKLIKEARQLGLNGGWPAVQAFRDAMFIIVGACAPERLRALATIRLDQIDFSRGEIRYDAEQIKMDEPRTRVLPHWATALLREWVQVWRKSYEPQHSLLWIAKGGEAPAPETLSIATKKAMMRLIRRHITPHRLRDAAATLCVEDSPESARLASLVLGHHSEQMTAEYTETANQINASRELAATIEQAGDDARRQVRRSSRSTIALNPRSRRCRRR